MMRRGLLLAVAAILAAMMVMLQAGSSSGTRDASACSGPNSARGIWCAPSAHGRVP
jgi:hypothetical protein